MDIVATGDLVEIETKSGEIYRLPCVEVYGYRAFFDDGYSRIQLNLETDKMFILKDGRKEKEKDVKMVKDMIDDSVLENRFTYHKPINDQ